MTTREADYDSASMNQPTDMQAATVYLALGTNLGDREANLRGACERIAALGLRITRRSSIYETEPVGFADQDWFLNQVIEAQMPREVTFDLNDQEAARLRRDFEVNAKMALAEQLVILLAGLLEIERAMGRRRITANGPRVIDIDLLLCGDISGVFGRTPDGSSQNDALTFIQQESRRVLPELILPHPRMHLRRFVLAPLCEIAPGVIHPTLHKTCRELLAVLDDTARVLPFPARELG